jgi:tRNA U38,U39,U40 pseudouridine synthase TruA
MVRLITAGLVEVGHGRISPAQFKKLLSKGDRAALPVEAAPPHGLYLSKVSLLGKQQDAGIAWSIFASCVVAVLEFCCWFGCMTQL